MAGGSQIIINASGITFITPGKFESKAVQHVFKAGEKVEVDLPILPFNASSPLCPLKSRFGVIDEMEISADEKLKNQ